MVNVGIHIPYNTWRRHGKNVIIPSSWYIFSLPDHGLDFWGFVEFHHVVFDLYITEDWHRTFKCMENLEEENHLPNHAFSGSMLIFRGVPSDWLKFHLTGDSGEPLWHPAPRCIESRLLGIKGKALMKAPWGVGFAKGVCWRWEVFRMEPCTLRTYAKPVAKL